MNRTMHTALVHTSVDCPIYFRSVFTFKYTITYVGLWVLFSMQYYHKAIYIL